MHRFQCWLLRGPLVATLLTCRQVSCRLNSGFPCAKHVIEFLRWTESSSKLHPKTIAVWVDMLYHVSSSQQQALRKPCRCPYETKRFLRCSCLTFRHCYCNGLGSGARLGQRFMPVLSRPIVILTLSYVVLMVCFHPCQNLCGLWSAVKNWLFN
jgi:hypothetical protein